MLFHDFHSNKSRNCPERLLKTKSREIIGLFIMVALIGIEPISRVPETPILSIELQSLAAGKDNPIIYLDL